MPTKDPRVDAYVAKSADFAKPILRHIRKLVHTACPDLQETLKWSMPAFMHKGMLCGLAAFKQHCAFGCWKHELVFPKGLERDGALGQLGRITALADLPSDKLLLGYLRKVVELKDAGVKKPAAPRPKVKQELVVPDYFTAALKKNRKAMATFEGFSYSHQKEYVEWITEAKQEATRARRLQTTLEWLAEGKPRNWKYASC